MVCGMADIFQHFLQTAASKSAFSAVLRSIGGNIHKRDRGLCRPRVRLPGSGGAPEIAIHAKRTLLISRLTPRAFPADVDFITAPVTGTVAARDASWECQGRSAQVITDMGILEPDETESCSSLSSIRREPERCACQRRMAAACTRAARHARRSHRTRARPAPPSARPAASIPWRHGRMTQAQVVPAPALARRLTLRDVVLLNIVAVISLRWLATSAATGPSALVLWMLAALFFFVPMGLAVSALSVRHPEAGGLYAWTIARVRREARLSCGWCYWVNNLLYYPNLLLFTASIFTYALGRGGTGLENASRSCCQQRSSSVVRGYRQHCWRGYGRWLQNVGAICTFLPGIALIVLASSPCSHVARQ